MKYYQLVGDHVKQCTMMATCAPNVQKVFRDEIGDILVSTVFLGVDHSFGGPEAILFETMIFGGEHNGYQEVYATIEEAREGHKRALEMVRGVPT